MKIYSKFLTLILTVLASKSILFAAGEGASQKFSDDALKVAKEFLALFEQVNKDFAALKKEADQIAAKNVDEMEKVMAIFEGVKTNRIRQRQIASRYRELAKNYENKMNQAKEMIVTRNAEILPEVYKQIKDLIFRSNFVGWTGAAEIIEKLRDEANVIDEYLTATEKDLKAMGALD